jgi:glutamine synthetase
MESGARHERSADERPISLGGSARPMLAADRDGFVDRHDLWGEAEHAAAAQIRRVIDERGIEMLRVAFADQHGTLRGKTLVGDGLWGGLRGGVRVPSSLVLKDTSGKSVYPVFSHDAGTGIEGLGGAGDVVLVPDPKSFRVLPWAPNTGWVLCDLHFPDARPVPFSTRRIFRGALDRLATRGYGVTIGVEIEFHVFRALDEGLGDRHVAAPGRPGAAPGLGPVSRGAQLLREEDLDALDDLVQALSAGLLALDLPLRSLELEFGPSQLELTLAPRPGLQAADDVILARTAIRQICRRQGYHATFMSRPAGADTASTGWHLHQSLVDLESGENAFIPTAAEGGALLSSTGQRYLGGLLAHAPAAAVFTTPTVNGYKRYRPFTLAPDRICWGIDNKGAMVRVVGGPGDPATRLENRSGEPAANPYLYMASQVVSGMAGIDAELDPGTPTEDPYAEAAVPLPASLMAALEELRGDAAFADAFGQEIVDWILTLKASEVERYLAEVSDWEQREYFGLP